MQKKIFVLLLTCLLVSLCYPFYVSAGSDDEENDGSYYYGYGDSITAGNSCKANGDNYFNGSYITRMQVLYDSSNTSDHGGDELGGNKVSYPIGEAWDSGDSHPVYTGTRYYYSHTNWSNSYYIFMLGTNDARRSVYSGESQYDADKCFDGMMRIYDSVVENNTIPIVCAPPPHNNGLSGWKAYFQELIGYYHDECIKPVPMWDALDTNKWDGVMDDPDSSYFEDDWHPLESGHDLMAEMLWYFIQGWDYNTTFYDLNNTLIVDADYNETIFINNSFYGFDTTNLTITCMDNSTSMPYTLDTYRKDGSQMIRFNIQKGCTYNLTDGVTLPSGMNFLDICGEQNNSELALKNRYRRGNCSIPTVSDIPSSVGTILDIVHYQVRIANVSSFTNPFINETGLNRFFMLTNPMLYNGQHYYQYRCRVKVRTN